MDVSIEFVVYEPAHHGRVEVISGCMFAGKTEELLRRLRRAEIASQEISIFTPDIDDRFGQHNIGSHSEQTRAATVVDSENPREIRNATNFDVVGIDEANFFDDSIVDIVESLADNATRVIICGTDQTFRGEPFNPLPELMAVADDVAKLRAVCSLCGRQATRNQRLIDGEPAHANSPTLKVGGEESYQARCRHCHSVPRE